MRIKEFVLLAIQLYVLNGFSQATFTPIGSQDAIVLDMKVDESKNILVASTPKDVAVWNFKTSTQIRKWPAESIQSIDLRNGKIAGVSKFGKLHIWELEGDRENQYSISSKPLQCVVWVENNQLIIGSSDGDIFLVSGQTGEIEATATAAGGISSLMCTPSNDILVGDRKGNVAVFGNNLVLKNTIKAHKGRIQELRLIENTDEFITISENQEFKQWKTYGASTFKFSLPGNFLTAADYVIDSDGKHLAAIGTVKGKIIISLWVGIYSTKTNAIINRIYILQDHMPKIIVLVATHGGGIQLIEANDMKLSLR